jgi:hypothetical protein
MKRKPTSTDIFIHNSCHSNEHKLAQINYLIRKLHISNIIICKRYRIRNYKNNPPEQSIQTYTHSDKPQKDIQNKNPQDKEQRNNKNGPYLYKKL